MFLTFVNYSFDKVKNYYNPPTFDLLNPSVQVVWFSREES